MGVEGRGKGERQKVKRKRWKLRGKDDFEGKEGDYERQQNKQNDGNVRKFVRPALSPPCMYHPSQDSQKSISRRSWVAALATSQ